MESNEIETPTTPWECLPEVWPTEARFWSWVRGALRKEAWARHPIKMEFIRRNRIKVPNPNPNGRKAEVYGMQCKRCKGLFILPPDRKTRTRIETLTGEPLNYIEINHRYEAGTLSCKEDLGRFAANLLHVVFDDLESLCKQCHGIVTYAQRFGVSEEEAEVEKEVIKVCGGKAAEVKAWLQGRGVEPGPNAKIRRGQVRDVLAGG